MGRLQTWIDRLGRSRYRAGATGSPARKRPLSFELCESRLALSATSPVADASDGDPMIVVLSDLWKGTPGTAQWAQVSFGDGSELVDSRSLMRIDYTIGRARPTPLQGNLNEGGLIALDSFATDGLQQFTLSRQSNAVVDASFSRLDVAGPFNDAAALRLNAGMNVNASASIGTPLLGAGPISTGSLGLGALDSAVIDNNVSILPDRFDTTPEWEFESTDAPDLLGETEGTSPMVEGGALNSTPPILRITAPLDPARTEGGRIDLTAMAGPTTLERQASFEALSAPTVARRTAARAADGVPTAANSDNLRARAVVYEVAYQRKDKHEADAGELGASRDEASQRGHAPNVGHASQRAAQAAARDEVVPAKLSSTNLIEAAAAELSTTPEPGANDSASLDVVQARDAALSSLGDDYEASQRFDDEYDSNGGLAISEARHRNVGLAIALAITAAPLARRYRRSKQAHAAERNSRES
jgi:hypothetical protein